jgi:hypothetical protein
MVFENAINPMKIAVKRNLKASQIFPAARVAQAARSTDSHQLASL